MDRRIVQALIPIVILILAFLGGNGFAAGLAGQGLLCSGSATVIAGGFAWHLYASK